MNTYLILENLSRYILEVVVSPEDKLLEIGVLLNGWSGTSLSCTRVCACVQMLGRVLCALQEASTRLISYAGLSLGYPSTGAGWNSGWIKGNGLGGSLGRPRHTGLDQG